MKILLIFTFFLISGLVVCFDVTGYQNGNVIIYCNYQQYKGPNKYFCKESEKQCIYLKPDQRQSSWDHKGKVHLHDLPEKRNFRAFYRDLRLEDAGSYQCGETGVWNHTVNLRVETDSCCSRSKTMIGYLGETVTISCSYPEEFEKRHPKYFYKLEGQHFIRLIDTSDSQRDRFSIFEDRSSGAVRLRISDVIEDDGGVYSCAVRTGGKEIDYYSLFTEIQLKVTVRTSSIIIIIILTVGICVVLLLIGGLTLIFYKLRCSRIEDSTHISSTPATNNMNNFPPEMQDIRMSPVSPNPDSVSYQSNSVYQNLDSYADQSDLFYECLDHNINQLESVYHSLDPNINQSDPVYQSLDPDINQSDSFYQSLDPEINQSDSFYQSVNPNTNQLDPVYQSLNPNTNQSDSF